jgi:hypothetical protein
LTKDQEVTAIDQKYAFSFDNAQDKNKFDESKDQMSFSFLPQIPH